MTLPDNRSPLTSYRLESSSTAGPFKPAAAEEKAIDRYTYGVNYSCLSILQVEV